MNIKIGDIVRSKIMLSDGSIKLDSIGIVEKIYYARGFDYVYKVFHFHYVRLNIINRGIVNNKLFNVKDLQVIRKKTS
jgi:hypothetical protein